MFVHGPCRTRVIALLIALCVALLAGCGENTEQQVRTVTVTPEPTTAVAEETATEEPVVTEEATVDAADDQPADSVADGSKIRVPNVVGKDHQLAQDTMQAAGLYNLAEEDAAGQGRMLIVDRNWTVVEQDPPAGSRVNTDRVITLRSKKDNE